MKNRSFLAIALFPTFFKVFRHFLQIYPKIFQFQPKYSRIFPKLPHYQFPLYIAEPLKKLGIFGLKLDNFGINLLNIGENFEKLGKSKIFNKLWFSQFLEKQRSCLSAIFNIDLDLDPNLMFASMEHIHMNWNLFDPIHIHMFHQSKHRVKVKITVNIENSRQTGALFFQKLWKS